MAIEVKLPDLGEGIDSADVLNVLVSAGDLVARDQDIIEIETDKATAEVPCPHAGKVVQIHVRPGQTIQVGQPLITLEAAAAETGAGPPATPPPVAAQPELPKERLATAAPAAAPPPAPRATPAPQTAPPPTVTPTATAAPQQDDNAPVAAGPAVRRLAREVGIDLATVQGSGTGGRVTRDDVLAAVRNAGGMRTAPAAAAVPGPAPDATSDSNSKTTDLWGPIRIERMTKIRKTIAATMQTSWSTIPRVTNFDDADVTELEKVRQKSKQDYAAAGIKLTAMPFIIKAVALSLKGQPALNATIDVEAGEVTYKQYVNIGIAVDSERGLVVPSLRHADQLCLADIARALATIAENVRTNRFAVDDLRGSTFTISNLGAIGGTYSTPIINPPEVALLLVGRSRKMPVVVDDQIAVRLMLPLSISYDHRLVDGAMAARFLNAVKEYLESPSRLLLAP